MLLIAALLVFYIWTAFFASKTYQSGDRPENVAFNYQMALIKGEYQQAYTYLSSSLENYPSTATIFLEQLEAQGLQPMLEISPCIYIEDIKITDNNAIVKLREQFSDPCTGIKV